VKPPDEFHNDANRRDGKTSWCKKCMSEYAHARYEANKERIKIRERDRRRAKDGTWKKNQLRRQRRRELAMKGMKKCIRCGEIKPHDEFHNHTGTKDGKTHWCKECRARYQREHYEANKNKVKAWARAGNLRRGFDITVPEYDEMLEGQDGVCAICGKTPEENGRRLAVDHDHETDRVRGLLCTSCNFAIGYLNDNPAMAFSAGEYLLMWQEIETGQLDATKDS